MVGIPYILDSDVFITAKNLYYAFDICPGFWKNLVRSHEEEHVFSIDRVRGELLAGDREEDLVQWVRDEVPRSFFASVDTSETIEAYRDIMLWIQQHQTYFDQAKAKFATGADGWLVAYAIENDAIVVTNERRAPVSRRDIKLPDVCEAFEVRFTNVFHMLRSLKVKFD